MIRRPPRSTRTDTLFPYTTLFRSVHLLHSALNVGLARIVRVLFRPKGFQGRHAVARPVRLSIGDVSRSLRAGTGCRRAPRPLATVGRRGASGYNYRFPIRPTRPRRWAGPSHRNAASMKILVAYKRVVDYNVRIQVKPDGSGVVTDGVKLSANPFDEIALEEALRLRDKGIATEVVVATIAPADAQAHLRNGLAMDANRAIHVVSDQPIQPLTAARTLLKLVEKEQPDLVILGKRAIDDDANQTGQMLATLWGRPQATFASKLEVADGKATVTREVDAGLGRWKSTCRRSSPPTCG